MSQPTDTEDRRLQTAALEASRRRFAALTPWRHLGALLLLAAVAALRYWIGVFDPQPRPDEAAYVEAFRLVASHRSPYFGAFFYLPAFAWAGAIATKALGAAAVLALLRLINVLGVAVIVWWSSAWSGLGGRAGLLATALFVAVAEPIRYGLLWGNFSLALVASLVVALLIWPQRPLLAGVLLGAGIALKPLAPAAVAALGVHRVQPERRWRATPWSRSQLLAGGVAGLLAALLVLVPPYLPEFLALAGGRPAVTRNVSLHRLLYCFGIDLPALALAAAVAVAGMLLVLRRPLAPGALFCFAVPITLLATPLVWSHTLLMTLPMQVMAVAIATRRWRSRPQAPEERALRSARLLELVLVLGAVLAIELAQGVGGIDDQPLPLQGLVLLPPVLAPAGLAAYIVRRTTGF